MNLFGIGPFELVVIFVIALIFIGPDELPKLARKIGLAIYEFRQFSEPYREQLQRVMEPIEETKREITQPLMDSRLNNDQAGDQSEPKP